MKRIEKIVEFLKSSPADSFLKHALALEYLKLGEQAKARQQFEEVLENEPGYVGSYYHLAKIFEEMGDHKQAIIVYEKGMEQAKRAGDTHTYMELKAAYEDLES